MLPSLLEKSLQDDERTMEETFDDEPAPVPVVGITMVQAQYEAIMAEKEQHEQPAPPFSVFRIPQEELRYNPRILEQHRLTEGQITSKQANEDVIAAMVAENPTFLNEQRALYQSMRIARDIRHKQWLLRVLRAKNRTWSTDTSMTGEDLD